MTIDQLIDQAVKASASNQATIAKELGINPARISEWKSGLRKPDASEIAYFADKAGMHGIDIFRVVAEIESQLRPAHAHIWKKAMLEGMAKS